MKSFNENSGKNSAHPDGRTSQAPLIHPIRATLIRAHIEPGLALFRIQSEPVSGTVFNQAQISLILAIG